MFPKNLFDFLVILGMVSTISQFKGVLAGDLCDIPPEAKKIVDSATEECVKSLKVDLKDESFKTVSTTYDDKGLILCTFQKLKLANDEGVIDKEKFIKMFVNDGGKPNNVDYSKAVQLCTEKSESQFKQETDKTTQMRKKTVFTLFCFHEEICPEVKPPTEQKS